MLRPLCFLLGLVPGVYSDFTPVAIAFFDEWKTLLTSMSHFLSVEKDFLNPTHIHSSMEEDEVNIPDLFASTVRYPDVEYNLTFI